MQKILVYGTILFDHIRDDYFIGGCHTNVAAHCAKLGMDTVLVSCVGNDNLGRKAVDWMQAAGIHTDYIMMDRAHPTGTTEVDLSDPSAPRYDLRDDVAYDYISLDQKSFQQLKETMFDFFYFGMVEQRHDTSMKTLYSLLDGLNVRHVFFDINLRKNCYTIPRIKESLKRTDILKVNEEELEFLASEVLEMSVISEKDVINRLKKEYFLDIVIVTRGEKGASAYRSTGRTDIAAVPVEVEDTVGAGDGFSAAFIYKYAQTGDLDAALRAGALMGSYVSGKRSAVPEYTEAFLKQIQK